jgi:hypothetical protein|tara:strand:- start:6732 stop:6977 length:246 start_codon:yes stop_codon:yes gene_type:complete
MGLALVCAAGLAACGQKRVEAPVLPQVDPATSDRLGLTADAIDPTERDALAGYNRWNPKPEPEGTAAPLSPTRRKIGAPPP